jgi:hypothetical protein
MTEKYICDGRIYESFDECENYAKFKGLRITNTETIRKNTFLITLNK